MPKSPSAVGQEGAIGGEFEEGAQLLPGDFAALYLPTSILEVIGYILQEDTAPMRCFQPRFNTFTCQEEQDSASARTAVPWDLVADQTMVLSVLAQFEGTH
ncbi:MAG: hypothetical protein QM373_04395 [Bacillota bacterium]|nr:hypothetical protein [Bacillota bacterium]